MYQRVLTGFDRLVFFTKLSLMESPVIYLALFLLFSVIGSFEWFWMVHPVKKIQLMLESLKSPFLVLHLSYYTLMTFMMVLSVILVFMLMILFFFFNVWSGIWSVATTRIDFWTWIYLQDTVDWGNKWLVEFNAVKTQLVSFDQSNDTGVVDAKMNGSVLEEKSFIKMLGLTLSSTLDWGSYIIPIAKTASKKVRSMKDSFCELFFSWVCYISLWIYHLPTHWILLSCLAWCP